MHSSPWTLFFLSSHSAEHPDQRIDVRDVLPQIRLLRSTFTAQFAQAEAESRVERQMKRYLTQETAGNRAFPLDCRLSVILRHCLLAHLTCSFAVKSCCVNECAINRLGAVRTLHLGGHLRRRGQCCL